MSSTTTNLGLTLPTGSENWKRSVINGNFQAIDDFAGSVNGVSITNQYSTVLDAINAYRTVKSFPFAIQKAGSSAFTDLPSGISTTCEWNVICYGTAQRITAVLTIFTGGSSMNGWSWTANIYEGSYILGWTPINVQVKTTTGTATSGSSGNVSLGLNNYQVIEVYAQPYICVPFRSNGAWYFKVLSQNDMSIQSNVSVSYTVKYL